MNGSKIVYGVNGLGLIFIPEERAKELALIFDGLMTAKTWGEFRKMLPKEAYEEYLKVSDHYNGPRAAEVEDLSPFYIADDTPFTPNDVFFLDNPPDHPEIEMSNWVPQDIQEKFGHLTHYYAMDGNAPGGKVLELKESQMDEIVQALEAKGYTCRRDDDLLEAAYGSSFSPDNYPD